MDITPVFGTVISGSNPDKCTTLAFHMKPTQNMTKIPGYVLDIISKLKQSSYEAQIVGGSVRDLLLGKTPVDWDIHTNANPEQILGLFSDSFYENDFGTVGVKVRDVTHETLNASPNMDNQVLTDTKVVEVTPYRREGVYVDGRRPESVVFDATLLEDLKRRDFTVNAFSYDPVGYKLYSLDETLKISEFLIKDIGPESIKDIKINKRHSLEHLASKLLVAVGDPEKRFREDYLRMLRAVRFATQLGFTIDKETEASIIKNSKQISKISRERVRDELVKIIQTDTPMIGFILLQYTGLLEDIIPELLMGVGMKQTENHKYDVFGHLLRSMQHAADKGYTLDMRITALLHDVAKPHTARLNKQTGWNSFHGHEVVGEKVSREILNRLKFPQELVSRVTKLIRWHMFNSDPDQVTMSAVRRMIVNVGRENIWDLMNLRFCDRIGSGRPLEEPHRLRRYFAMIEEALTQPTDLKMLKIDGQGVMNVTHETPGRRIGLILKALMGEVLEKPELNTEELLKGRSVELSKLTNEDLYELAQKGEEELEDIVEGKKKEIRKRFKV